MSKFKISQSALKSFFDTSVCDLKWEEMYLNGYRTEPSAAMLDGLVFEQHVIGFSRGGEVYEIPKGKTGKPLKRETDLLKLAEISKQTMQDLDIELIDVQPHWEVGDLVGHPDALIKYKGELALMDLKYTGVREDEKCRWNPFAWGQIVDPQTGEIYKDFKQALHYVEMYYQTHGVYLPFFYLVFGKSGWCKFIFIDISANALNEYRDLLERFRIEFKNFKPKPINNYEICRKCTILCDKRTNKPNIETIKLR